MSLLHNFLFKKTPVGDYAASDRATFRDFLLNLVPMNEVHLGLIVLHILQLAFTVIAMPWDPIEKIRFAETWEIVYLGSLLQIPLLSAALITLWLRLRIYFPIIMTSLLTNAVIFTVRPFLLPQASYSWTDIPFVLSLTLLFCLFFFSSNSLRMWFFPIGTSWRRRPRGFPPRREGRYRILLIDPTSPWCESSYSPRRLMYPSIIPYVAALVPSNWDVMILDEVHDEIDYDIDVDVVGLTTWALAFPGTRRIAKKFKEKGRTVILGGPDVSLNPASYADVCDTCIIGEAEYTLHKLLDDWIHGNLKKQYRSFENTELNGIPIPRYDLLPPRRYANYYNILVSTSCPFNCSFCNYNRTRKPRLRPVEEVVAAMEATPSKFFWLEAPELFAYKPYLRDLSQALKGRGIQWASHATMRTASDESLIKIAYGGGCRMIWLGLESFSQKSLDFINKKTNQVKDYQKTFDLLNRNGISACTNVMFGIPTDTPEDYERTRRGLIEGKTGLLQLFILATHSGDEIFEQSLYAAGGSKMEVSRKVESKKTYSFSYNRPANFTDQMLVNDYERVLKSYYAIPNILRRLMTRHWRNLPNLGPDLIMNLIARFTGRMVAQGNAMNFMDQLAEKLYMSRAELEELLAEVDAEQDPRRKERDQEVNYAGRL